MESILDEAKAVITGARHEAYGPAAAEFDKVAEMWAAIIDGKPIEGRHVPLCMMALKLIREAHRHQRDNLTDICGYAALLDSMMEMETASLPKQMPAPKLDGQKNDTF